MILKSMCDYHLPGHSELELFEAPGKICNYSILCSYHQSGEMVKKVTL